MVSNAVTRLLPRRNHIYTKTLNLVDDSTLVATFTSSVPAVDKIYRCEYLARNRYILQASDFDNLPVPTKRTSYVYWGTQEFLNVLVSNEGVSMTCGLGWYLDGNLSSAAGLDALANIQVMSRSTTSLTIAITNSTTWDDIKFYPPDSTSQISIDYVV